nr:phosphatidylinositol-glycan biosynthesis class F protein [Ipomoea batatas]
MTTLTNPKDDKPAADEGSTSPAIADEEGSASPAIAADQFAHRRVYLLTNPTGDEVASAAGQQSWLRESHEHLMFAAWWTRIFSLPDRNLMVVRCTVSMRSVLFNKPLAWAIFSGDQWMQEYVGIVDLFPERITGFHPVNRYLGMTLYWSLVMSVFTFVQAATVFGSSWTDWHRIFAQTKPAKNIDYMVFFPAHGAIIGAWFGAWPMPLDWERPWQIVERVGSLSYNQQEIDEVRDTWAKYFIDEWINTFH